LLQDSARTPVLTTLTLPDGSSIAGVSGKIESQLIALLSSTDPSTDTSTWFNFDRLNFEAGSAALSVHSKEQLKNIAAILSAYPTARIKIGGYTDSSGDPSSNLALSELRAQAVKSAVVQHGIAVSRIEAEGYGSSHPLSSDETAAGRANNRRIAVRLLER
jgi:outer membrane protein OmpA-like peptidoglycan-associated protein